MNEDCMKVCDALGLNFEETLRDNVAGISWDLAIRLVRKINLLTAALEEIADKEGCTIRSEKESPIWDEACEKAFGRCAKVAKDALRQLKECP